MVDIRFKMGRSMIIAGPSSSGKTEFVKKLILNRYSLFDSKISAIHWHYGIKTGAVDELRKSTLVPIIDVEGCPKNSQDITPNSILVLDDLMEANCSEIFTKWAHHIPCFVIRLTQNLFTKDRTSRINAHYIVLLKNPADQLSIKTLFSQMCQPSLMRIYHEVTQKPYTYLLINNEQNTCNSMRIMTNILPNEYPPIVYVNKQLGIHGKN